MNETTTTTTIREITLYILYRTLPLPEEYKTNNNKQYVGTFASQDEAKNFIDGIKDFYLKKDGVLIYSIQEIKFPMNVAHRAIDKELQGKKEENQ